MSLKEIDYSKTLDSDELDNTMDHIRGVAAILNTMYISLGGGGTVDNNAFLVLENTCHQALKEFEEMKPKLEYMEREMR
jgi:hypothetical protein